MFAMLSVSTWRVWAVLCPLDEETSDIPNAVVTTHPQDTSNAGQGSLHTPVQTPLARPRLLVDVARAHGHRPLAQ